MEINAMIESSMFAVVPIAEGGLSPWFGFGGALLATLLSAFVAIRQQSQAVELARLSVRLQREQAAEEVLKRYREPLAAAAFDLQSRLYNIVRLSFFAQFDGSHGRCEIAETTTLFRMAQYFGWTEILRRDIQFLAFPEADETKQVVSLQAAIAKRFGTSRDDHELMIWTDEQRAIGERMIVEEHGKVLCMGFARFHDNYDELFAPWCERLRSELHSDAGRARLRDLQHLLCDLVVTLDPGRIRYTRDFERA